jgi:hypothetical protein
MPPFRDAVIDKTSRMEGLLLVNYRAFGRGLNEKANSVENDLDPELMKKIRFVAAVRNKLLHVHGYQYDDDEDDFLATCDEVIAALERNERRAKPAPISIPPDYGYPPGSESSTPAHEPTPETYRPPSKPWYRSTVFLVATFFLLPPLWAILILTDQEQSCLLKLIAGALLLAACAVPVFGYRTLTHGRGLAPRAAPIPSGMSDSTQTPTASPKAKPATKTPVPTPSGACVIEWQDYDDEDLAGKNRNMVWNAIVKKAVTGSGMTAAQFYQLVVDRNPSLKSDGYVFQKGKTYLLPDCKGTP